MRELGICKRGRKEKKATPINQRLTSVDEVQGTPLHLRARRVDHVLAIDAAEAHRRHGATERDVANRQRGARGVDGEDVV